MEERGPIQVAPPGLLGLLQLKVNGAGISKLGDTCVPSLEMAPWWLRANTVLRTVNTGITVAAGPPRAFTAYSPNDITVPQGQWWYVDDYTVEFQTGAGGAASNLALAWASTASGTIFFGSLEGSRAWCDVMPASDFRLLRAGGFWLPPGARLGFWVDTVVGAAGLFAAVRQLRYAVLPS